MASVPSAASSGLMIKGHHEFGAHLSSWNHPQITYISWLSYEAPGVSNYSIALSNMTISWFRKNKTESATASHAYKPPTITVAPQTKVGLLVTSQLENALEECRTKVAQIVKGCRAANRRFRWLLSWFWFLYNSYHIAISEIPNSISKMIRSVVLNLWLAMTRVVQQLFYGLRRSSNSLASSSMAPKPLISYKEALAIAGS